MFRLYSEVLHLCLMSFSLVLMLNIYSRGTEGSKLQGMTSIFFEILSKPGYLRQYRVDFNPEIELMGLKMGLLKTHMLSPVPLSRLGPPLPRI